MDDVWTDRWSDVLLDLGNNLLLYQLIIWWIYGWIDIWLNG